MKASYTLTSVIIGLGLMVSCSELEENKELLQSGTEAYYTSVTMSVPPFELEEDGVQTKNSMVVEGGKVKYVWNAADTVGIFPQTGSQIYFSMKSGAGQVSATFDGGGWALKRANTYFSYYPFIPDYFVDRSAIPISFLGQKQVGSADPNHADLGKYCYMVAKGVADEQNGNLYFDYQRLGVLLRFKVPAFAGEYKSLTIKTAEPLIAATGTMNATEASNLIANPKFVDALTLDLTEATLTADGTLVAFVMVPPFQYAGKQLDLILRKADDSVVISSVIGKDYTVGKLYAYTPSLSLYPTDFEVSNKGGVIQFNLVSGKTSTYTLSSDVDWITFDPSNANSGSAILKASLAQNTGKPRTGHIFVSEDVTSAGVSATLKNIITVRQTPDGFNAEIGGWGDGGEFGGEAE